MKKFIVNENDSGQRTDKFISKVLPDLPKSMMYRLIRKKDIKVNGKRCEISTRLECGDIVTVYVPDRFASGKKADMTFLSAPDIIEIVYEDDNILIVSKPVGLDVHCSNERTPDTLIDRIKHYLYNKGEYIPENENSFSPALCSRLDRNTCGLVTAAKNAAALREFNQAVKCGYVHKTYHCITCSPPPQNEDIATAFHFRAENSEVVTISDTPDTGYKEIKTGYKLLASSEDLSLLEVELYTGRTHQIRAHLAHLGCPILGDGKYGNTSVNRKYNTFMQALCAYRLTFSLPDDSHLAYLNELTVTNPKPSFEKKYFAQLG